MDRATDSFDTEGEIDLRAVAARLWARRTWIIASAVIFTAAFAAASFIMTPIYRATTVLVPAEREKGGLGGLSSALGQFGGLAALAGINLGSDGSQVEESLAVMRSREFTERFISEKKLLPELFYRRWNADSGRWRGAADDTPTLAQAHKRFDKKVRTISQDKKTGLITMHVDWKDPDKAAAWANELVALLNAEMRQRAIATTNASVGYLQKELAATNTVETRNAISRLMEAQINQRMFANVTTEYALRVVDRALPADRKDVLRPKKTLLISLGLAAGLLFGVLAALMADAVAARRGRR